jgi:hypothetical protein
MSETDQGQRTERALQEFETFVRQWTPPSVWPHLIDNDNNAGERVRSAIRAIADCDNADPT